MSASTYKWDSDGIRAVAAEGGDPGNFSLAANAKPLKTVRTRYVDLTKQTAASAVQYKIMTIPAYAWVSRVQVYVATGENLNFDIGDSSAATTFLATTSFSAAGIQTVYNTGKLYTAADEVNFKAANAASNGKFYVQVEYSVITNGGGN